MSLKEPCTYIEKQFSKFSKIASAQFCKKVLDNNIFLEQFNVVLLIFSGKKTSSFFK